VAALKRALKIVKSLGNKGLSRESPEKPLKRSHGLKAFRPGDKALLKKGPGAWRRAD
jgi:hypothetical protein